MSHSTIIGQCPHCGSRSPQAFLPAAPANTLKFDPQQPVSLESTLRHTEQRLVCSDCEKTWEAAIVPKAQMDRLLSSVSSLEDARRQIAMMRLIMSKDQVARADRSREEIIKIRRAA